MNDTLVDAIVNYSQLYHDAKKPVVATWRPYFIERCANWCVYIETELLAMSDVQAEACRQKAIELSSATIPELSTLMDALRHFCTTLLGNAFVNNELYWMVMSTYALYNPDLEPEKILLDVSYQSTGWIVVDIHVLL